MSRRGSGIEISWIERSSISRGSLRYPVSSIFELVLNLFFPRNCSKSLKVGLVVGERQRGEARRVKMVTVRPKSRLFLLLVFDFFVSLILLDHPVVLSLLPGGDPLLLPRGSVELVLGDLGLLARPLKFVEFEEGRPFDFIFANVCYGKEPIGGW